MQNSAPDSPYWRRCNSCKKPLPFSSQYWVCNVSTCNRKRTGMVFCSVSCWDAHLPIMNHRESWAEERKAPTQAEWQKQLAEEAAPKPRKKAPPAPPPSSPTPAEPPSSAKAPTTILRRNKS